MAKKSKGVLWTEYAVARSVLGLLGILPRALALKISSGVAVLGMTLLGSLRRTGLKNLEIAFPDMSEEERLKILRGTFHSLGRVLGEVSQFHKATPEKIAKLVDFDLDQNALELWETIKRDKRGLVITTGHLGNWEMLVFSFAILHQPISYLARPIDNPMIEEMTVQIRSMFGNRPINKANSAMVAIRLLREGEMLGVLADVNAHPKEGVFVPFFGIPACTTAGPATLAIRTNALLFPIFCVFDKDRGKYKIVHGTAMEPVSTGDRQQDIVSTTAAYTEQIENIIRQYPDQWLWIHKRWKTRPKGESGIY
jgi:Kdo2-lipid IVA lauroyltransferase/acyltransferase